MFINPYYRPPSILNYAFLVAIKGSHGLVYLNAIFISLYYRPPSTRGNAFLDAIKGSHSLIYLDPIFINLYYRPPLTRNYPFLVLLTSWTCNLNVSRYGTITFFILEFVYLTPSRLVHATTFVVWMALWFSCSLFSFSPNASRHCLAVGLNWSARYLEFLFCCVSIRIWDERVGQGLHRIGVRSSFRRNQ